MIYLDRLVAVGSVRFGAIEFILAAAADLDLGRRRLISGSGSFLRGIRSDRVTVRWFGPFA
jgi:hypothetical protein